MSEAPSRSPSAPRVLVVEDEHEVCELLSDILASEGFETVCARSDRHAYEALRGGLDHACMVVDVNLGPGTTGYDVARFARGIQPGLPVVYVSGQASEASHSAFGVAGSLFVAKPFSAEELMDRVRRAVGDNDD